MPTARTTSTIDLSLASDPKGSCPECRTGHLVQSTAMFPTLGPRPVERPCVECRRCGYIRRVEPGTYVVGVGAFPLPD